MQAKRVPEIRTSERTTWRQCPQKWWWGYRMGLVPKGLPAIHFWFGIGWHEALAEWYKKGYRRGTDPRRTWNTYVGNEMELIKTFDDGQFEKFVEAGPLGEEMLTNYLDEFGKDKHMYVLATERTRRVPIYDYDGTLIAYYLYTMDGIYRDKDDHNQLKILEHKTAAMISLGHLALDSQARAYVAFETIWQQNDGVLHPDDAIVEITYNFARKTVKKVDDRPTNAAGERLNKDGSVSKQQRIQEPLFVRHPVGVTAESRAQVIAAIITEAKHMQAMRDDPELVYKNPMPGPFGCSSCPFKDMCELHEEGGDWKDLMAWKFVQKDPYGPYRKAA